MKITVNEALANYYEDLCYNGQHWDLDNLNHITSGTPEFESAADMDAYIASIKSLITCD